MTLLTYMESNKQGVVTATTKDGKRVVLEGCAQVDVVFGLNEKDNVENATNELKNKAQYDDSRFYWFPILDNRGEIAARVSDDKKTFAIPYAYFIR